jgi:hypothetical protein
MSRNSLKRELQPLPSIVSGKGVSELIDTKQRSYRHPDSPMSKIYLYWLALSQPCLFLNSNISSTSSQIFCLAHCIGVPTKATSSSISFSDPTGVISGSPTASSGSRGWRRGITLPFRSACSTRRIRWEMSGYEGWYQLGVNPTTAQNHLLHGRPSSNKIPVVEPR